MSRIRLASAPVSWGILEFEGVQPRYRYERVLDEIAETGYEGTELGPYGYLPTDPAQLKAKLDRRGLTLLSAFVPVDLARPGASLDGALEVGRLLAGVGAKFVVLADDNGKVPELVAQAGRRRGSWLKDWKTVAANVRAVCDAMRELELDVVFHHHCAGCVETPEETQALLEHTDISLCLDTGHWHYAGGDAVECLRTYGSRVAYLHFKDCDPESARRCRAEGLDYFAAVRAGVFCPLGQGEVDFPALIAELERSGYEGWAVVEQDILGDDGDDDAPRRFSRANRDYLAGLGL